MPADARDIPASPEERLCSRAKTDRSLLARLPKMGLAGVGKACGMNPLLDDCSCWPDREVPSRGQMREAESMKRKCVDLLPSLRKAVLLSLPITMLAIGCALAVTTVLAQTAHKHPLASQNGRKGQSKARQKSAGPAPELSAALPEPAPPPPPPLTPEQMPPKVPQVSWDGKWLTITSDNSTLADILTAIRTLTGAELDIPPNASSERIAARLGPGPAREVLSTLLSWTDFDYVIQASDIDPAGIRSVLLTRRGKSDVTVASAGAGAPAETPARALYRGYARPHPNKSEEAPAPENPAATQAETAAETPQPISQPAPSDSQPATAAVAPPPVEQPAASTAAPTASSDAQPIQADLTASAAVSDSSATQAPVSESEQRIQQMQNLFQQRKQMIEDASKPPAN
jgi:hypothetical protein